MVLEPGVTVVVGPNGSGKSNVVDAIAWVLGAQAPKAVRSQKMDDVIFAGTATRPALGRAEVSITIDNSDGTLGVELSEITVTRVLFRNGDSEYAINGAPCRLLDVQELLSDAGVGPSAARDRQPGSDRRRPQRSSRGAAGDHRGGSRRPQVPQAQGEGRASPRRDRGEPAPRAGPAPRGASPTPSARTSGAGRRTPRVADRRAAGGQDLRRRSRDRHVALEARGVGLDPSRQRDGRGGAQGRAGDPRHPGDGDRGPAVGTWCERRQ